MKEFEPAIRKLRDLRLHADSGERRACFEAILPLLSAHQDPEFVRQVEKLVLSGGVEQAIELIEGAPVKRRAGLRRALSNIWMAPAMLVVAVLMAALGVRDVTNSTASPLWPTAPGTVLESRLVYRESSGGIFRNSPRTLEALVRYHYIVKGRGFESQHVSYRQETLPRVWVARYPEGSSVLVHYKPDEPDVAVLEPGFSAMTYAWFGGAVIFLLFAMFSFSEFRGALGQRRR